MINWKRIADVGYPTDVNKTYLVTDGTEISTTEVSGITKSNGKFTFKDWIGDSNTDEENSCCSGDRVFLITPTHWFPTDELNLPK